MHQICNNSFQSSFTRLVTWISTQGHVLTRTPAASVMCPNTSWVLCQGKYSFRWWWGIFSEMMVSIRYSLFWKTCFILPTLHCLIFLQFLLKLHLLLKCELVTAFTCRLVSLPKRCSVSHIAHLEWMITSLSMPMWAQGQVKPISSNWSCYLFRCVSMLPSVWH